MVKLIVKIGEPAAKTRAREGGASPPEGLEAEVPPEKRVELDVPEGGKTSVLDHLLRRNVWLNHECMGQARCSQCRIIVEEGEGVLSPLEDKEADCLDEHGFGEPQYRLGCQAKLESAGSLVIRIAPPPGPPGGSGGH